jgi:rhodanese-related sulfurtransferase
MLLLTRVLTAAAAVRPLVSRSAVDSSIVRARPLCASAGMLPPHIEDLKEDLESGEAQLFDVREPNEAAQGMLSEAQLVPLSELQRGVTPEQDPTKLTYVHCAAGIRVHYAAPILESMGFERVVPLQEGFASLVQLGFETK